MRQLAVLGRLKKEIPFSDRLNAWISQRVVGIKFEVDDFPEMTFEEFKADFEKTGVMKISSENCEGTIFGDAYTNILFRVWHDSLHLQLNEDFSYMAEARVAFAQAAELPADWWEERHLIMIEVIAQAAYHEKTNNFVTDQRDFIIMVLRQGVI